MGPAFRAQEGCESAVVRDSPPDCRVSDNNILAIKTAERTVLSLHPRDGVSCRFGRGHPSRCHCEKPAESPAYLKSRERKYRDRGDESICPEPVSQSRNGERPVCPHILQGRLLSAKTAREMGHPDFGRNAVNISVVNVFG